MGPHDLPSFGEYTSHLLVPPFCDCVWVGPSRSWSSFQPDLASSTLDLTNVHPLHQRYPRGSFLARCYCMWRLEGIFQARHSNDRYNVSRVLGMVVPLHSFKQPRFTSLSQYDDINANRSNLQHNLFGNYGGLLRCRWTSNRGERCQTGLTIRLHDYFRSPDIRFCGLFEPLHFPRRARVAVY